VLRRTLFPHFAQLEPEAHWPIKRHSADIVRLIRGIQNCMYNEWRPKDCIHVSHRPCCKNFKVTTSVIFNVLRCPCTCLGSGAETTLLCCNVTYETTVLSFALEFGIRSWGLAVEGPVGLRFSLMVQDNDVTHYVSSAQQSSDTWTPAVLAAL
jgi:hypothetical protein